MRPPLAGKRATARRLAEQLRRRLKAPERVDAAPAVHTAAEPATPTPTPQDAAARIDAARERLRATIVAPMEPEPENEDMA